jgi:hypothetical protein
MQIIRPSVWEQVRSDDCGKISKPKPGASPTNFQTLSPLQSCWSPKFIPVALPDISRSRSRNGVRGDRGERMIQQRVISPTRFLERKGARGFPPRALLGCMHLFAIEIRMRGYRWLGRFAAHFAYRDILEKEGRHDKRNRHRPFVAERGQAHIALWAEVDGEDR